MRPEVHAAWRRQIEREVSKNFPEFVASTKRVRGEPRGILKYQWHPHPKLWCFIAFRGLDSEAFDALVGWSTRDRFPIADGQGFNTAQDLEDFDAASVIDWSLSFVPRNGAAHWNFWDPPNDVIDNPRAFADAYAQHFARSLSQEEANELIRPAVGRGIAEVRDFGLPYLRRRAAYEAEKQT
jgi:hypothetical protein